MKHLFLVTAFTALLLPLLGCEGQPASRPEDDRFMLGNQGLPVGDPSADPFRPSDPVQLFIPAGPPPRQSSPYQKP